MKKDVDVLNRAMGTDYTVFKSDKVSIEINKKFIANLETLANTINVSSYSIFLTTLYILLYKYTSKINLIIGTPFSEGISKEFQDIIGNFSNDIILRQNINPNLNFIDFVKNLNKDIIDTVSKELSPYEFIKNTQKENVFFDALLIYQASESKTFNIEDSGISKPNLSFEIDLELHTLNLEFNKNAFEVNTAKSILAHYFFLLKQVCNNVNCKINDLEFITPEENRLLEKFNLKNIKIDNFDVLSIFDTHGQNAKIYILDKDMKNVPIGTSRRNLYLGEIKRKCKI